jgi:hypothetical protein
MIQLMWEWDGGHFLSDLSGSHKMSQKNSESRQFLKTYIVIPRSVFLIGHVLINFLCVVLNFLSKNVCPVNVHKMYYKFNPGSSLERSSGRPTCTTWWSSHVNLKTRDRNQSPPPSPGNKGQTPQPIFLTESKSTCYRQRVASKSRQTRYLWKTATRSYWFMYNVLNS